jgi:hypothetical protein
MLETAAKIDIQHVPYKGAAASVTDLVGGRIPISLQSMPSALPFMQSGKLRVIAVANEKRMKALPDVPAMSETVKGYGATPWYGMFAHITLFLRALRVEAFDFYAAAAVGAGSACCALTARISSIASKNACTHIGSNCVPLLSRMTASARGTSHAGL